MHITLDVETVNKLGLFPLNVLYLSPTDRDDNETCQCIPATRSNPSHTPYSIIYNYLYFPLNLIRIKKYCWRNLK